MIENDFPEKLLYYSKIDKYCVDVILKNTFGITDPTRGFNDPLDCYFEFDYSGWQKEDIIDHLRGLFIVENYIEKGKEVADLSEEDRNVIDNYRCKLTCCTDEIIKQRISAHATKEVRNYLSKFLRIRSFSAQTADRTLNNIMFSHYGDSHRGLCYIFDSKKLIPNELIDSVIKVDYLPGPASIEYKSPEEYSDEELKQIGRNMVRIKHEDWKYEKEWRLMIGLANPSKNINEIWEFESDALEGIVLGLKTTKEDEDRIKILAEKRQAKVNIYKAERRYGSFYLDYENNKVN
ncbi:MAG TPA: DUF2971 domain-containing protein [candidate division Zixibacteria bacterium]|nr:DUF2971 domain-containing protein [candidate division Zixibacteria bacterium]